MPIRKVVRDQLRKAVLWALEPEPDHSLPMHKTHKKVGEIPDLKDPKKTRLVLASMLHIHDSIVDAEALQGYEGNPEQLEELMWQVYGILAMNPEVTDTQEVHDIWLEDYAGAQIQKDLGWVPEDYSEQQFQSLVQ